MFELLTTLRDKSPLVHNITNVVVTNFTANGLYALGASPVMAYAKEEVEDMAKIAGAVVLNIGTLSKGEVEAMILAGNAANKADTPVIFDPVGAGATPFRTQMAQKILEEVKVTVIRGNAGEIASVAGEKLKVKGVDGGVVEGDTQALAEKVARIYQCTVAVTGEVDIVTNGHETNFIHNGHPFQTLVTGVGCLLSSVVGAFCAIEKNPLTAATAALAVYGVAAEKAAKESVEKGPGSFQIEFLNQLYQVQELDETLANISAAY